MTRSSPKCLLLPTIHTYILWKNYLSPVQAAMAFYGIGWRGPGLSNGKFCVYFSLEEAGSDREGRGQNLGWGTDRGCGVSPSSAPDDPTAVRPSGEVSASGTHVFLRLPNTPDASIPPASPEAPGLHWPRVGHNQCQEYMCLPRSKASGNVSESPKGWQSRDRVTTAHCSPDWVLCEETQGGFSTQQPNADIKHPFRSPELSSPGKGLYREWLQIQRWMFPEEKETQ